MAKKFISRLWIPCLVSDIAAIAAAYYTTLLIRFHSHFGDRVYDSINAILNVKSQFAANCDFEQFYLVSALRIIFFLSMSICFLYSFFGLYVGRRFIQKHFEAWNIVKVNIYALFIYYGYWYLTRNHFHPRSLFGTMLFLNIVYCLALRHFVHKALHLLRTRFSLERCSTILIGTHDKEASLIEDLISMVRPHGLLIVDRVEVKAGEPIEDLLRRLATCMKQQDASMVICADKQLSVSQLMQILKFCDENQVATKILSNKIDVLTKHARIPTDMIRGIPLVHFSASSNSRLYLLFKRAWSTMLAALLLIIAAPFLLLIALLIRITSHGSVLFIQERIGINRQPFKMLKFRTMHHRADETQAQVEEFNESGTGLFKIRKDPRVTPIGRFLRRFSLDELPQLINVIKGEMTIVGPRPLPRRDYENYYEDWHYTRHGGLPGLTCLWQVSGRSDIDFHNMCILDVYYLRNQTIMLDIKMMLRTVLVVLFAKGAY